MGLNHYHNKNKHSNTLGCGIFVIIARLNLIDLLAITYKTDVMTSLPDTRVINQGISPCFAIDQEISHSHHACIVPCWALSMKHGTIYFWTLGCKIL